MSPQVILVACLLKEEFTRRKRKVIENDDRFRYVMIVNNVNRLASVVVLIVLNCIAGGNGSGRSQQESPDD